MVPRPFISQPVYSTECNIAAAVGYIKLYWRNGSQLFVMPNFATSNKRYIIWLM
jgi:hypothetical protein